MPDRCLQLTQTAHRDIACIRRAVHRGTAEQFRESGRKNRSGWGTTSYSGMDLFASNGSSAKRRGFLGILPAGPDGPLTTRCGTSMASFRFLHAADVHLDSPVGGLNGYPGARLHRVADTDVAVTDSSPGVSSLYALRTQALQRPGPSRSPGVSLLSSVLTSTFCINSTGRRCLWNIRKERFTPPCPARISRGRCRYRGQI